MGVNWDSGVLFWKDHIPSATERLHAPSLMTHLSGRRNAKPRLWRGFVIPDPLTCHRGRPLARRACTKPVFVHFS
jgi:hypothetical protein